MPASPPRVRFSPITQEFGRMGFAYDGTLCDADEYALPFQLGEKPSGDVFMSSPKAAFTTTYHGSAAAETASDAMNETGDSPTNAQVANNDRCMQRSVTTGSFALNNPVERTLHPSSMSARHKIGGVDVQGIYPATACVFVANLPEHKDDRALEAAVTREFSKYGTVFVKIRRDGNHMPFAFCQFTNDEDANTAMDKGRGTNIHGRPCRTEMVRANRSFIIYIARPNHPGEEIDVREAREILEPYGELTKCEMLSARECEELKIPKAVLVEFATFDPKRDINSAARGKDKYNIDAFDTLKKSRSNSDEEFLRKYDVDRRSVFVGGLPYDMEKDEMIAYFSEVGEVVNVDLIKRTNFDGSASRPFGFVEFTRADVPDKAINSFNGAQIRDSMLKVERKVYKRAAGSPRRVRSQAFFTRPSSTPKTPRGVSDPANTPEASGCGSYCGPRQTAAAATHAAPTPQSPVHFGNAPYFTPAAPPVPPSVTNGQPPLIGASGLPISPSSAPYAPNAYPYMGGFYPGVTAFQDPITGYTYYSYNPTPPVYGVPHAETPTRGRGHGHRARDEQKQH
ncbi:Multicopy suppressor of sporulation protein msa1 [Madurella mycetomatis]|uniref:Multicopy suppressor of sporulation protein msa1 n=1 Tax=Madurella mycetomatis TaxID=100816 RepID=A0A175WGI6_9PEZI|nr:Multicopy suppressor of sporulation protein msa1 [Madurella mycetomatis]